MRKDLCPIDLINLENQMDDFLEMKARRERLINLAAFAVLFLAVALVAYVIAGERLGL
jgi:hypothetical protein